MPASTSLIAEAIAVEGLQLQFGNGASPQVFTTVCNVSELNIPISADVVDVTNVGDTWRRRIATLLDMGKIKFKIFWVMTEPTHENAITGNIVGIRYILTNRILTDIKVIYPDGSDSEDTFPAYVTGFNETGKVGGVFEADCELSNSGEPTLA